MNHVLPHFDRIIRETRLLWAVSKAAILGNLTIFLLFALFDPESRIYTLLRHPSRWDEAIITLMALIATFLYTDICKFDVSKHARRHWLLERFVPITYMVLGFGYLALSFVASAQFLEAWPLVLTYVFNAGMAGAMAFLTRLRLQWSTS